MPNAQSTSYGLEVVEGMGIRSIAQTVKYTDFVDSTSVKGTMTLRKKLPAYCFPIGVKVKIITGFTGDTSCKLAIGTSTTSLVAGVVSTDILSSGSTLDIYTASKVYMQYASLDSGNTVQDDGQTIASNYILLTAISGSDWTLVTAGEAIVTVYYLSTVPE